MAIFQKNSVSDAVPKEKKNKKQKAPKAERPPQYCKSLNGGKAINYTVYYLTASERILYFLIAFVVGGAVGFLFYGGIGKNEYGEPTQLTYILNTAITVVSGLVSGKLFLPIRQKQIFEKRRGKLKQQFRDMLESISTALGAGKNVPESFLSALSDLSNQYEEDAFILQELDFIKTGLRNGFTLEQMLNDFAQRSGCEEIQDFAGVFEICYRRGGNIKDTIRNTCKILSDKMGVMEEIETTISSSKNEQYIMLVMPVGLVGMIKLSSAEFAANFATTSGLIATTVAVAMFVAAYFLGRKLMEIKV